MTEQPAVDRRHRHHMDQTPADAPHATDPFDTARPPHSNSRAAAYAEAGATS